MQKLVFYYGSNYSAGNIHLFESGKADFHKEDITYYPPPPTSREIGNSVIRKK